LSTHAHTQTHTRGGEDPKIEMATRYRDVCGEEVGVSVVAWKGVVRVRGQV